MGMRIHVGFFIERKIDLFRMNLYLKNDHNIFVISIKQYKRAVEKSTALFFQFLQIRLLL